MATNGNILFSTPAGPMIFRMRPGTEKQRLKKPVEDRGGIISSNVAPPSAINLTEPGTVIHDDTTPYYSSSYIDECIKANRLLELDKFKLDPRTSASRRIETAESDEDFTVSFKDKDKAKARKKYTTEEDIKMIQFVFDNRYIDSVKGISVWKTMEQAKIVEHPFQSLRDRFVRHILPNLERYSLDPDCRSYMNRAFSEGEASGSEAGVEPPPPARRSAQSDPSDGKPARRGGRINTRTKSDIRMPAKRAASSSPEDSSPEKTESDRVVRQLRRRRAAKPDEFEEDSSPEEIVIVSRPATRPTEKDNTIPCTEETVIVSRPATRSAEKNTAVLCTEETVISSRPATRSAEKNNTIPCTEASETQCTAAVLAGVISSDTSDGDKVNSDVEEIPSPANGVASPESPLQVPADEVVTSPEIHRIESAQVQVQPDDLTEEQAADLIRCLSQTHKYMESEILFFFTLVNGGVLDAISLIETGKTTQGVTYEELQQIAQADRVEQK